MKAISTWNPSPLSTNRHGQTLRRPLLPRLAAFKSSQEPDVAVFRFTLGNEVLDRLTPRIAGSLGLALLLANHLTAPGATDSLSRTELIAASLASFAIAAPWLEQRILELGPGRGRKAPSATIDGATSVFVLDPSLTEAAKAELAWASFTLLRTTNACSVLVYDAVRGRVLMARGAVSASLVGEGSTPDARLDALSNGMKRGVGSLRTWTMATPETSNAASSLPASLERSKKGGSKKAREESPTSSPSTTTSQTTSPSYQVTLDSQIYTSDKSSLVADWPLVPRGVEAAVLHPIGPASATRGILLVLTEQTGALSTTERTMMAAVASKMGDVL